MLVEHRGAAPTVHSTSYVAPTAVVSGDVTLGPDVRILHGAVVSAEDGSVTIGARCVVMENAVVRGRRTHPVVIGDDCLVGPHVHLNGARVGAGVFLATGCALFPGAVVGERSEVRIHGVVHVNTVLAAGSVVPIGWVAVGDPASVLPPGEREAIWAIQEGLDFPGTVYGVSRDTDARERMTRQVEWFAAHRDDRVLDDGLPAT
jgi:gamma-carbonic anhydrase